MTKDERAVPLSTKRNPRRWGPQEIIYLKRHYAREGIAAVATSLQRSIRAVKFRLTLLNLQGFKVGSWTREEDTYLRAWYGKKRPRAIGRKLKRSWQSVTGRAIRLGLKERNIRPWTQQEIEFLKRNYLRMRYYELARHLRRARGTVNAKLRLLGLRKLHEKKRWTSEERRLVRKKYRKIPGPQLAMMLKVPVHVLEKLAVNMKLVGKPGRKYTQGELEYIRLHYRTKSAETVARKLGRTPLSITSLASKRGWKGRKSLDTTLTDRQQQLIRKQYRKRPAREIAKDLGLQLTTVRAFAKRVGLVLLVKPFSTREHRFIKLQLGKIPIEAIAKNLGRGVEAVRDYGHLQGWEFRLARLSR